VRRACVGCASSGVSGGGWTCPGVDASGCPSSSPGGGGWPMPRADEEGREAVAKLLDGDGTWPSSGAGAVCRARDGEALWRRQRSLHRA
jgi:hypothetical protein